MPSTLWQPSGVTKAPGVYRAGRLFGKYEVYYSPRQESTDSTGKLLCIGRSSQVARNPIVLGDAVAPVPLVLAQVARIAGDPTIGAVAKMVIAESRNFPDLAKVWHDQVVAEGLGILAGVVERAQARGECRAGDPRLHAFSIIGPMITGLLWGQVFAPVGGAPVEMGTLAAQHAATVLEGLTPREQAA